MKIGFFILLLVGIFSFGTGVALAWVEEYDEPPQWWYPAWSYDVVYCTDVESGDCVNDPKFPDQGGCWVEIGPGDGTFPGVIACDINNCPGNTEYVYCNHGATECRDGAIDPETGLGFYRQCVDSSSCGCQAPIVYYCTNPSDACYGEEYCCGVPSNPDLVAGQPTPATANVGVPQTFYSIISNQGDASTESGFYNFFQVASAADGGGTVTNLTASLMPSLSSGGLNNASASYIFPSSGTYSVRAWADKSNPADWGTISESNEDNNFSQWRNVTVSGSTICTDGDPGTNQMIGCIWNNIGLSGASYGNAPRGALASGSPNNFVLLQNLWPSDSGPSGLVDNFSARWQGNFSFTGGTYTFAAGTDDGFRLYIDGALVSEYWADRAYAVTYKDVLLTPGVHSVKFEYYEKTGGSVVFLSWRRSTALRQAQCAGIIAPDSVSPSETFNATVSMINTGADTWINPNPYDPSKPYRLGSQNPQDNALWGLGRVDLPSPQIAPGQTAVFSFVATAPSAPGTYSFDWKMLQELVAWFSTGYCADTIEVSTAPFVVASVSISADPTEVPYGGSSQLNWSYSDADSCTITPPATLGTYPSGSGSVSTGNLTASRTYTITCQPGSSSESVTVTVQAPVEKSLNVIKTGQGTVTSSPAGIDCGSECSADFNAGEIVILTAEPATGRIFTGWFGGGCSGRNPQCAVVVDTDKTVYANFAVDPDYREF